MKKRILHDLKVVFLTFFIAIIVPLTIIYILFCGNQRYVFPEEIGKIELNYEVRRNVFINCFPMDALETLEQIEQEQGYVNIEELERLREKFEAIDSGYIIYSYRRPLRYIVWYKGQSLLGEYSTEQYGSFGRYGVDNGNVLYFYRVRQSIIIPYDGYI